MALKTLLTKIRPSHLRHSGTRAPDTRPARRRLTGNESGQAVIEYVLLLSVVVGGYLVVVNFMNQFGLAKKLTRPITTDFAAAYQLGDIKAKDFDNGGPERHPRVTKGKENFRIFINPDFSNGG
jgi:hypothetical protein